MAARPGEENVATLYADVHYFYGPADANPPHHRFDKGSYVYLFENANDRRARIEIANHPGTDDQDAFEGFLDRTRLYYSYSQQCLVSITVEGVLGPPINTSQWHLPTYDPHNQNKYHYKLHSIDIYFWTHSDALQFVNGIRRVLPAPQVEVADEPAPPTSYGHGHSPDINPLVQKLENAAISDPRTQQQQPAIRSFAPPPTTGLRNHSDSPQSFVPMAYNPAAPPEAEKYQHREKTPPPPEDDGHDPLAAAMARDQAGPLSPGYGQMNFSAPPGMQGLPGPLSHVPSGPMSPGPASQVPLGSIISGQPPSQFGHPQHPQHPQRSITLPAPMAATVGGLTSPYGPNYAASPGSLPPTHHQPTPPPAVQSPGLPPPPPGGYSQFNYANAHQAQATADYSIHQQLYRPTESEHTAKHGYKPKADGQSKLGQNAERLERGVTGMLKKFEKKFG
ncbi:hypothetical protein GGS21DRAFT_509268 [Xylaria nigripes]|nr:hypothetical protein GGS21DRAFT_509268 [Xylaria nigripes]